MSEMEKFFSRAKASEGIKFPLYFPGTTDKSEHYLVLRGMDSNEFRVAEALGKRKLAELAALKEDEWARRYLEIRRQIVSSLIAGWSFEQECTPENVMSFLKEAPHTEDVINKVASDRSLFFMKGSESSTGTPDPSSN